MPSSERVYPVRSGVAPDRVATVAEAPAGAPVQAVPADGPPSGTVTTTAPGVATAAVTTTAAGDAIEAGVAGSVRAVAEPGLAQAVAVLTRPDLAHVVDLVAWVEDGWLHVANADGASRLPVDDPDGPWEILRGRDPVADQDPMHGVPLVAALADPSPPAARNAYPFAGRRLLSMFADPTRSPDIAVVHTPRHYWPERGGHLGEHGSLDAGQSRAPLVLSGAGVTARGLLPRVARVIDVAPTLAALAGAAMPEAEGTALDDLAGPGARHVVGLLWDGTNCNDLLDLAARGELPNVARLLARGVALTGGALAEFPSVTLTNHTSAITGVGPGRHGILHNVYFDRATDRQVITNEAATWHVACDQLRDGVSTVFEAVARSRPGTETACVNEPIDRGASYSTFGLVRALGVGPGAGGAGAGAEAAGGGMEDYLPAAEGDPHASAERVTADPNYAWSTRVDALGLTQIIDLWADGREPPVLTWWNTTITDTGHHGGGPYSPEARAALADADRRLGVFLDLVERRGLTDQTAILLTADHGFEAADPDCRGDWDVALHRAGVVFRDEGYGFIYLGLAGDDEAPADSADPGSPANLGDRATPGGPAGQGGPGGSGAQATASLPPQPPGT
ncbi:Type I phosphodiesterase/nucleotide pyrophosphatase [Parafrankia sp. Ea1.12]|uniref:alkaline phosphatase family protein n=1 Tax=Parafrankia sp. Ea1.12 TaxID=573499 RepID=UPI000DA43422|nr:alkaline phosphatase family protein [Parafrankia sp. Ea1.12]SQD99641.1 Type I phosphodiesterase/nucleotide pyrophosphatase [Parafrankia sp. Ea1.12]